ncbi:MAG: C39 family peptidase [Pseudomonadaceae bacterium]|nr:C39 family peptidase [Pseudomonadaceae bacterium]
MNLTIRLAERNIKELYPLSVDGEARWYLGPDENSWQADIPLPALPKDHIIVPSYMQLQDYGKYHFEFCNGDTKSTLQCVPAVAEQTDNAHTEVVAGKVAAVSTHIDCWHTTADTAASTVTVVVKSADRPHNYLLVVGLRSLDMQPQIPDSNDKIIVPVPASISQMQADTEVARRICSPTALQMALSTFTHQPTWEATVSACYDPISRAYGSWPLAIRWAGNQGVVGAVEVFVDWADALVLLQQNIPMVCSIRFDTGKLKHAPLTQTPGHLVLLYGVDGNEVLVKDPAAAGHQDVERRYALDEFINAWLSRRGAAYVLAAQTSNGN